MFHPSKVDKEISLQQVLVIKMEDF